jgi:hypothetical protein
VRAVGALELNRKDQYMQLQEEALTRAKAL